jgi:DNA-binding response OmpR family regulator
VLCASIRSRYDVPIIICSATGRKQDRILALRLGADDFIAKPFEIDDLLARVQAVLRRSVGRQRVAPPPPAAASYTPPPPPAPTRIGNLVLDRERRRVKLGDKDVPLTPSEFRLLAALMSRPDDVVTRDELAHVIWGPPGASTGRAIDVHIRRLRAKLAAAGAAPPEILTVRGSGYRIVADRTDLSA